MSFLCHQSCALELAYEVTSQPMAMQTQPDAYVMVYANDAQLFFQVYDRVRDGFWAMSGAVRHLDSSTGAAEIGKLLLEALSQSRIDVPLPPRGSDLEASLRSAMGVRSRRAWMADTRACSVNAGASGLKLMAHDNGGTQGENRGFRPNLESARQLPRDVVADELGRAVLGVLERATIDAVVK